MSFTRTAVIRAPPERIFSVLADLGQTKQWMPAVQSIDNVTPGPVRVGTGWKETRKAGKRTMESTIQVALYRQPWRLGLQADRMGKRGQMTVTLAPKEGGTEDRSDAQMAGKALCRLRRGMRVPLVA